MVASGVGGHGGGGGTVAGEGGGERRWRCPILKSSKREELNSGIPQLQQCHEALGFDRALKFWAEIWVHFKWVHFSHVSHMTAAWFFMQGLAHAPHGYLNVRGGPGLVSKSPDKIRREQSHVPEDFTRSAKHFLVVSVGG